MRRVLATAVAVFAVAGFLGGCSTTDPAAKPTPASKIETLPASLLPPRLVGLDVTVEDVSSTIERSRRAFVDQLSLYSLRTDDKLMATVQVSRANDPGEKNVQRFRDSVIGQIGSSQPRSMVVGGQTVYITTGTKQRIAFWFKERFLFVLATRDEFTQRRTLLRELLAVEP